MDDVEVTSSLFETTSVDEVLDDDDDDEVEEFVSEITVAAAPINAFKKIIILIF
jgi:hypothetical protein